MESIKSLQQAGKRVNWDAIAQKLPNRTKMQCKSYFTNIMKKNTDVNLLKYHIWTRDEQEQLRRAVNLYGENWQLISREFPYSTPQKIAAKYHYMTKCRSTKVPSMNDSQSSYSETSTDLVQEVIALLNS